MKESLLVTGNQMSSIPGTAILVHVVDMPQEVEEWCVDQEVSTHYQNDVVIVHHDRREENPLFQWATTHLDALQLEQYRHGDYYYIAIIAT